MEMPSKRPSISDAERIVLKALWTCGQATVREIHELLTNDGNDWNRSTVITLLQRLEKKGYVTSDKSEFAFVFRPAVSRDEVLHQELKAVADELADGAAAPLVLAFAYRHRFTAEEIEQFRKALKEMEAKRSRRR